VASTIHALSSRSSRWVSTRVPAPRVRRPWCASTTWVYQPAARLQGFVDDSRSHSSAVSDLCGRQRVSLHPRYAWMRGEVRAAERAMVVLVGSWGRDSAPSSACQPSGMRSPAVLFASRTEFAMASDSALPSRFCRRASPLSHASRRGRVDLHFTKNSRRAARQCGRRSPA